MFNKTYEIETESKRTKQPEGKKKRVWCQWTTSVPWEERESLWELRKQGENHEQ